MLSFGIDQDSCLELKDGCCIRSVSANGSLIYQRFLQSDCIQSLVKQNAFINTDVVSCEKGARLVVRHPEIPFVLYPFEWTPTMLRDAALAVLDVISHLERGGYTLKDGHPWNVVFDASKPVWVDLTSVIPLTSNNSFIAKEDFCNYFLRPLKLFSCGLSPYARLGLTNFLGPPASWLDDELAIRAGEVFSKGWKSTALFMRRILQRALARKFLKSSIPLRAKPPQSIDEMRNAVASLRVSTGGGEWTNYYRGENELPLFDPVTSQGDAIADSTPKHRLVSALLKEMRPKSVLDIGCNAGVYSCMAEAQGSRVCGIDTDEGAIERLYTAAKTRNLRIITGLVDCVTPMRAAEYLHKPRLRSLHSRLRADLVLCLAVIHHWVFKRTQLNFHDIAAILSNVTKNMLVVEFVPPTDKHVAAWMNPKYDWYTLENFIKALEAHFTDIHVRESFPSPRVLLVCRKRLRGM